MSNAWRKLDDNETIEFGDFLVSQEDYDMNMSKEQFEKLYRDNSHSPLLPTIVPACGYINQKVIQYSSGKVWRLVMTEEPISEPVNRERNIQLDL